MPTSVAKGPLRRRQEGQPAHIIEISWQAQRRLHRVWRRLAEQRGKRRTIVAVAVARELTGFCWALANSDRDRHALCRLKRRQEHLATRAAGSATRRRSGGYASCRPSTSSRSRSPARPLAERRAELIASVDGDDAVDLLARAEQRLRHRRGGC
jgi:hypothetical protein